MENNKSIIFYIIFFLFCIAISTTANAYDYDLWARLIAGMSVVQSGIVLKQDFLSYTPTHTWFDHEWGSGVVFYITQHLFSSTGILILQGVLTFFIFFTVVKIVKLRGVKTTTPYNFLFYYFAFQALFQSVNSPVRCQMFSFLFFAVFIYILELARKDKNKPLILLPFIMILWNNLHGGCVAGIGLIFLYIVGEFLNKSSVKKYFFALISTILVLPINPWGLSYLGFLAQAVTMKRPDITEWWGLFSNYYMFKFMKFKIFAAIILITEFISFKKTFSFKGIDKTKFLILASTLFIATEHIKLLPFFVIASSAFVYDDFYTIFNHSIKKIKNKIKSKRIIIIKESIVYGFILLFVFSKLNAKAFSPIINFNKYAVKEIEFIKTNEIKGNLLINFGQGSYAAYKLYPNNLIFMDGRYEEVYYGYMIPLMKDFYLLHKNWEDILNKFPPDVMVIEKSYLVYNYLKIDKKWKLVYEGKNFGVFVPYKKAKKDYKQPTSDINYYKKTIFDTNILFKKHKN